jgi:hypothetical protein
LIKLIKHTTTTTAAAGELLASTAARTYDKHFDVRKITGRNG